MITVELPCYVHGELKDVKFYMGDPKEGMGPITNQIEFVSQYGVVVPDEVSELLDSLVKTAVEQREPFESAYLFFVKKIAEHKAFMKNVFNKDIDNHG